MNNYRRGLEKLGVIQVDQQTRDVRTDPAFAWRVLEAFNDEDWLQKFALRITYGQTLAEALYAAVEEVGRE